MNHRKYLTAIIWGLTASLLTSCNGGSNTNDTPAVVPEPIVVTPPPVVEPEPTKEEQLAKLDAELATVDAEIKEMIGQAQCASSLDCRLLGEGGLPLCGGLPPDYYAAAYSVIETDQNALLQTYEQRSQLNGKISSLKTSQTTPSVGDSSDGMVTCQAMIAPIVQCTNNRCSGVYSAFLIGGSDSNITYGQINTMIGYPVCSSSEQCGVWQVGYSLTGEFPTLCGEDTTFAYSTFATDPKEIAEKVGQYAQSVAANYNAQGFNAVCQSSVSFTNGVCRNEKCEAN